MKKRVVPFETVETFINVLKIQFYGQTQQPDYDGIRQFFLEDSFEVESKDEHESEDEE